MNDVPLTDQQRFPLLSPSGRQMLERLRQHPAAPQFNYHCGEKLSATGLQRVKNLATTIQQQPTRWQANNLPDWLPAFVKHCYSQVPFYRQREQPNPSDDFSQIPFTDRHDLRKQPWSFVPDSADLDELIVYSTSGTTGNFLQVICDPYVPASYLPLLEYALLEHGLKIEGGSRVSIMHVAAQKSTFTHCSVMSYFDCAGFVKVNLHPDEWAHPDDRLTFIDDCNPEIITGDPFAFVELSKLKLRSNPKALISSATELLPAIQEKLEQHFACPVIDMISTNETGPIGFGSGGRHRLFPHRLYVEIVNEAGIVLPPGCRGEIVVTGGINSMMPLLRYRMGDHAALEFENDQPILIGYSGRTPVDYFGESGQLVRSIDVIVKLYQSPLPVFRLHQTVDGRLQFLTRCDEFVAQEVQRKLFELFGSDAQIEIEQLNDEQVWQGKSIQFTSDYVC